MKIAPSILTADFSKMAEEIKTISQSDYLHIDIMDGHFVPNISFGPAITKQISAESQVDLDIHLMVSDPCFWIDKFAFKNTAYITIHYEAKEALKALKMIKDKGIGVGLSIKPSTPVDAIYPLLKEVDLVLVMSVEPGFGGQAFMMDSLQKIKDLANFRAENSLNYLIEVDGGINHETAPLVKSAGVDIAVVGSYLFNQKHRNDVIKFLR